jgi:hypothetical protein
MSRGARWLALTAICAAVAVVLLDTSMLNVASPTIGVNSTRSTLEGRSHDHDVH